MPEFTAKDLNDYNQLLNILYSEGALTTRLSDFLHQLVTLIFFDKAAVYFFHYNGEYLTQSDAVEYNVTSEYVNVNNYYEYYEPYDDLFSSINTSHPIVIRFSDYYDFEKRLENPAWREFYIPSNIYYGINANIVTNPYYDLKCGICLYRDKTRNDFTDKDVEIIRFFQPHLGKILSSGNQSNQHYLPDYIHVGHAEYDSAAALQYENSFFHSILSDLNHGKTVQDWIHHNVTAFLRDYASSPDAVFTSKHPVLPYYMELSKSAPSGGRSPFIVCLLYDLSFLFSASLEQVQKDYGLTKRESDILSALLDGFNNNEIASKFYISVPSVKKYVTSLYGKLGVKSSRQLLNTVHIRHMPASPLNQSGD